MKTGTSKTPKYIPIHSGAAKFDNHILNSLLAFHSLISCDSSLLMRHTKILCWSVFKEYHNFLPTLGKGDLSDQTSANVETTICSLQSS